MALRQTPRSQFIFALFLSSLVSIGLFIYGAWKDRSFGDDYLVFNLFLAWIPLVFAMRLIVVLRHKLWSSWEALFLTVLWLIFLPNSFYMISDFIHLQDSSADRVLYDAVMFSSFIYTAFLLGYSSLYPIHLELRKRLSSHAATGWIAITLFISSVAIYAGRDLRWNSWNVFTNPGGLLLDMSNRLLHPDAYPEMLVTIISFFVLLMSMYNLVWRGARALRQSAAH